jgi:hypothetical protein
VIATLRHGVELMAGTAREPDWSEWVGAFEGAGLDVDVPERSGADEVMVPPGSIGQVVDDDTGAMVFVSFDELRRDEGATEGGDVERGLGAAAVNVGLRLGGGRLLRVLGRKAGGAAARRWEAARRPELIRWFRPADRGRGEASVMDVDGLAELVEGPSLLWLHDALGRSDADFSELDAELLGELCERYQGRVWAYDHPTLHLDPSQNAGRLMGELAALGRPFDVDVVGFGRGGLVARALAEWAREGPVRVGALVTVGTPHLGTPLADEKGVLAWVNRLTNLAVLAPDPVSDMVAAVASVVAHAVEGTVGALVGFTAMGSGVEPPPSSGAVPLSPRASRSLFVGGEHHLEPDDGVWRAIKSWASNTLLDDQANDLFVPLDSALGRRDGAAVVEGWPTDDLAVSSAHGAYFGRLEVERALRAWLLDGLLAPPAPTRRESTLPAPVAERRVIVEPPSRETASPRPARRTRHETTSTFPTLHVRLLHASLEHAQYPVLVGHFAGSPLSGAEERLDDCLENRLSRAQVARDYPEALGEFRHFPGYEGTPPPGAIVVGLGPVGDLTESQLTSVVTRSLVRYASERRDRERASVSTRPGEAERGGNELGVASVLIGTSRSSGLTVEGSVRAIVAGVVAANLRLAQAARPTGGSGLDDSGAPIFTELRFVARHEDMVELAARALDQLRVERDRRPGAYPIHLRVQPTGGEGAAGPNPPDDSANDVWARLRIESSGPRDDGLGELTYGVMARSARADEVVHRVDPGIVDDLIAKSINRRSDPRIGATLYELLVPHELKQPLGSGSHLHLLLDEHTADHPWELLTPRGDAFREARPVALGGGLLRQFLETGERRLAPERAPERTVLVIGNPPPGPGFSSLAGAARESLEVVEVFGTAPSSRSWQVTARIWDTRERYVGTDLSEGSTTDPAENIVHELMTGSWRVVHIAAHGSFDPGNAALSGVVLGPGRWLTSATVGQLDVVPDLVVLNACHLGAIKRQLAGMNRVAASLARRLMQIGVRAVIAAGWAVGDIAAAEFAKELYSSLLDGRELGEAVLQARSHVHDFLPSQLTWGAYQCYGDPGFRLAPRRQRSATTGSGFLTVSELRRGIRAAAGVVSDRTSSLSALRRDIEEVKLLAAESPDDDRDLVCELELLESDELFTSAKPEVQANIAADLAVAWAELGDFNRAAGHYRFAIERGGNDVPLIAVEQLVNMSVRLARQSSDAAEQQRLFNEARQLLRALDRLGPTAERMALWGSFHKKRACSSTPPNYDLVAQAARRYQWALELDGDRPKAYHELNARQLSAIVWRIGRDGTASELEAHAVMARSEVTGTASGNGSPPSDFWSRSELGDRLLTSLVECAVSDQPSDRTVEDLKAAYVNAFRLRSSAANRRSVIEHLEDVAAFLPVDLELQQQLSVVSAELREQWLPSATPSPPSAAPIVPR